MSERLEKKVITPDMTIILRCAKEAGALLRHFYYTQFEEKLNPDNSTHTPFDEQAEKIAKTIIREHYPDAVIMGEELSPNEDISGKDFWTIDGIDGTTNYARKIPVCNFTMAKVENGVATAGAVFDFLRGELYFAVKGMGAYKNLEKIHVVERPFNESLITFAPLLDVRKGKGRFEYQEVEATWEGMKDISEKSSRFHREFQSGGLELSWLASGKLDGYASSWTSPWDLSAGVLIVKEAGGIATNIRGDEWQPSYWGVIAGSKSVQPKMLEILQRNFESLLQV